MLNAQTFREKLQSSFMLRDSAKKADDKSFVNPYAGEKSAILLETRAFNESSLNADNCCRTLTKVLYLLTIGEQLTPQETTSLFFSITKLFQSKNDKLRRMIYLLIKQLNVNQEEVFIVTSSLTKDMNNTSNDCYRANAIRVMSRIVDASMVAQIDRYLKTAIVDKNSFVQSSALICGLSLLKIAPDIVKRWTSEVSSALQSKNPMVQFHALALLYELKSADPLALQKVVISLCDKIAKSSFAECLLVRYATYILLDNTDGSVSSGGIGGTDISSNIDKKNLLQFLVNHVKETQHSNETVMFEALRGICELLIYESKIHNNNGGLAGKTTCFGHDVSQIVQSIHMLLISSKPVVRFAAVRLLNKLSYFRPHLVSLCNEYMESLFNDSNRSIATLALIALLKTGHEANLEKLVKQLNTFMSEIADLCKIEIVSAVKQLCFTYPIKSKMLMGFLSSNLREEGSYEFKVETVDALILLSQNISAAQEIGLLHLCEFIEDCEYPTLCTKILCFLGDHVPNTKQPSKYIRFIYNRLILENALIRAASVDALTKIAYKCSSLRKDIMTLLECCIEDNDDEVRDRTNAYYNALDKLLIEEKKKIKKKKGVDEDDIDGYCSSSSISTEDSTSALVEELLNPNIKYSIDALCDELKKCINNKDVEKSVIDLQKLPSAEIIADQSSSGHISCISMNVMTSASHLTNKKREGLDMKKSDTKLNAHKDSVDLSSKIFSDEIMEKIQKIVSVKELGRLIHSCKPVQLTETEAEYSVQIIKHMYNDYVILQAIIANTLSDQKLENVSVQTTPLDNGESTNGEYIKWSVVGDVKIKLLSYNSEESCYVILKKLVKANSINVLSGIFQLCLKYTVKEDNDDVGYEDEYPLEQLIINLSDYIIPKRLRNAEFAQLWRALEHEGYEMKTQLVLSFRSVHSAIDGLIKSLNLYPCENTDKVEPEKNSHLMLLSGYVNMLYTVLCKIKIVIDSKHGCVMQMICRSKQKDVCECLIEAFE